MSKDIWMIEYEYAVDQFPDDVDTYGYDEAVSKFRGRLVTLGFDADEIDDELCAIAS